jgi:hypothetical protein
MEEYRCLYSILTGDFYKKSKENINYFKNLPMANVHYEYLAEHLMAFAELFRTHELVVKHNLKEGITREKFDRMLDEIRNRKQLRKISEPRTVKEIEVQPKEVTFLDLIKNKQYKLKKVTEQDRPPVKERILEDEVDESQLSPAELMRRLALINAAQKCSSDEDYSDDETTSSEEW